MKTASVRGSWFYDVDQPTNATNAVRLSGWGKHKPALMMRINPIPMCAKFFRFFCACMREREREHVERERELGVDGADRSAHE